jgi:protein-tyrosine phosphatase
MSQWIALDGAVNVRDVGGISTSSGAVIRSGRLIRADNLVDLSDRDVKVLVDELGVRSVSDLRTGHEVRAEGSGPLTALAEVRIEHNSLFSEVGTNTDAAAAEGPDEQADKSSDEVLLPWQVPGGARDYASVGAVEVYWRYLVDRPDSVVATLRLIAHSEGATIVHCAAGKDRTGVVVAMALSAVGADPSAIAEDFALTAQRLDQIFDRLRSSPTYEKDVAEGTQDLHMPRAATMLALLERIDERSGGVQGWLAAHGWTDTDQRALEAALVATSL